MGTRAHAVDARSRMSVALVNLLLRDGDAGGGRKKDNLDLSALVDVDL